MTNGRHSLKGQPHGTVNKQARKADPPPAGLPAGAGPEKQNKTYAFPQKQRRRQTSQVPPGTSDVEPPPCGRTGAHPRGHAVTDLMLRVSHPRMVVSFAVATWVPVW